MSRNRNVQALARAGAAGTGVDNRDSRHVMAEELSEQHEKCVLFGRNGNFGTQ